MRETSPEQDLRVVFLTRPAFFDAALERIRALTLRVQLDVVIEVSPEDGHSNMFRPAATAAAGSLQDAVPLLQGTLPGAALDVLKRANSAQVFRFTRRALDPLTIVEAHRLASVIRSHEPHVLHLEDGSLRSAFALRMLRGLPVVLDVHDPHLHPGEGGRRSQLQRRISYGCCKVFVLHNHGQAMAFVRSYGIDPCCARVILLGPYHLMTAYGRHLRSPSSRIDLLLFGRLSQYKGLEPFLASLASTAESISGLRVAVVGNPVAGFTPPPLPVLARGGRVDMRLSNVEPDDLAALIRAARVVVLPYVSATQSGVALTAFAFGKPVVASAVGGLPEYVIDGVNGLLVPPCDPLALSEALTRVLADDRLLDRLAEGVRRTNDSTLAWPRIASAYESAYRTALA